tara:strand:+ start:165 stop:2033 length:1869 start_codon:yes stop_codon:yes gene_type:complete
MALPKGPLLAPIGRSMQEIAVEDIAKEIAAEFQKQVPMDMSHNVNVHVDPIQIEGLEDSTDADRIVDALNAIRSENPDAVEVVNSDPVQVTVVSDANKVDKESGEENDADSTLEYLDLIVDTIRDNTSSIVDAIRMNAGGINRDADKEAEQDDREDAAREDQDEAAAAGKDGEGAPEKNKEQSKFGKAMSRSFKSIGKLFKKIFSGFNLFILAIGAVVLSLLNSGGVGIMTQMKEVFNTFVTEVIPPILEMLSNIGSIVMPFLLTLMESIGEFIAILAPMVTRLFEAVLPPVMLVLTSLMDAFMGIFEMIMPVVLLIMEQVLPPLAAVLASLMEMLGNLIEMVLPPLLAVFKVLGVVIGFVAGAFSVVFGVFNSLVDIFSTIGDGTGNFIDSLSLAWGKFKNGLLDMVINLAGWLPSSADAIEKMEAMKTDTAEIEERMEARTKEKVGRDADAAIADGIDMDAPYMEVQTAVNRAVADRTMSKEVGQAILAKKEEKDLLENPKKVDPDPNKDAIMTMDDLFGPSSDADKAFVQQANMLPAEMQEPPQPNIAGTSAAEVNMASADTKESEKNSNQQSPPSEQKMFASTVNSSSAINNITTGVISTGGVSSLGHRHRRVLPGVA